MPGACCTDWLAARLQPRPLNPLACPLHNQSKQSWALTPPPQQQQPPPQLQPVTEGGHAEEAEQQQVASAAVPDSPAPGGRAPAAPNPVGAGAIVNVDSSEYAEL